MFYVRHNHIICVLKLNVHDIDFEATVSASKRKNGIKEKIINEFI